ncbi:MAG: hypothetical protein OXE99_11935 [Cellvibrionales bacterium]|nr:hypothetical protein [Cellvibrionales bacterium]
MPRWKYALCLFSLPTAAFLTGCEDSIKIETERLDASYAIYSNSETTKVSARFEEKTKKQIKINDKERFFATAKDERKELSRNQTPYVFGIGSFKFQFNSSFTSLTDGFSTEFDGDYQGEEFVLEMTRDGQQTPSSTTITLPIAPEFITPAGGEDYTPDNTISVSWTPSNISEKVGLHFASECDIESQFFADTTPGQEPLFPFYLKSTRSFDIWVDDTGSYDVTGEEALDFGKYLAENINEASDHDVMYITIPTLDCEVEVYLKRNETIENDGVFNSEKIFLETYRKLPETVRIHADDGWSLNSDYDFSSEEEPEAP